MKGKSFTEKQIIAVQEKSEAGTMTKELGRRQDARP
jgi:hypothetical protein